MKERGGEQSMHEENLTNHLRRFFDDREEVTQAIQEQKEVKPRISKAELFRRLSSNRGHGKSHVSAFNAPQYDGKLKQS